MDVYCKYQAGNGAVNLHYPRCIAVGEIIRIRTEGSVREKAFLGADLSAGWVRIRGSKPKMSQALAALIAGSTPLNVCAAVKQWMHREAILSGVRPLHLTYPWVKETDVELPPSEVVEEVKEAVIPECHEPHPAWLQEIEQHAEQVEPKPPSEKFLTRLAKIVGVDAWLRAGVAADL